MSTPSLNELVHEFQQELTRLSKGDITDLRRASLQDGYTSAALYKLLTMPAVAKSQYVQVSYERQWGELLSYMANDVEHGQGERFSLGRAMAQAEVSELRLTRLLNAPMTDEQGEKRGRIPLHEEVRKVLSIIQSKQVKLWWSSVAKLIFYSAPYSEEIRRTIARDYYSHINHTQNTSK